MLISIRAFHACLEENETISFSFVHQKHINKYQAHKKYSNRPISCLRVVWLSETAIVTSCVVIETPSLRALNRKNLCIIPINRSTALRDPKFPGSNCQGQCANLSNN